jgi:hypothetical protein
MTMNKTTKNIAIGLGVVVGLLVLKIGRAHV